MSGIIAGRNDAALPAAKTDCQTDADAPVTHTDIDHSAIFVFDSVDRVVRGGALSGIGELIVQPSVGGVIIPDLQKAAADPGGSVRVLGDYSQV